MTRKDMLDAAHEKLASVAADNTFGMELNLNVVVPQLYNTLRLVCAYLEELEKSADRS